MNPGSSIFKLYFCTSTCLSNNSLISSWISAKFVSAFLPCMLYLSYYFQPEVNTRMYLRKAHREACQMPEKIKKEALQLEPALGSYGAFTFSHTFPM